MSRSAEAYQEQVEQDNLSGIQDAEWYEAHKGMFECPYCGDVFNELQICCGEVHAQEK